MKLVPGLLLLLASLQLGCSSGDAAPFTVGGAASATEALDDAVAGWNASDAVVRGGRTSFAASSTIARQLQGGAPYEVVVSADRAWIERLVEEGLVDGDTVVSLASNALVLAVRSDRGELLATLGAGPVGSGTELSGELAAARWTTGDPEHVPVGGYAREALEELEWWARVEGSLLAARDVRAAVRLVEIGEADLCVAYASDVVGRDLLAVPLERELHRPIELVGAVAAEAGPEARAFLAWLTAPDAPPFGASSGFLPPEGGR